MEEHIQYILVKQQHQMSAFSSDGRWQPGTVQVCQELIMESLSHPWQEAHEQVQYLMALRHEWLMF